MSRSNAFVAALTLATLFTGCAGEPPSPDVRMPEDFSAGGEVSEDTIVDVGVAAAPSGEVDQRWWTSLNDPVLTALVVRALEGNQSLAVAWTRITQSRAIARQVRSARMPMMSGTAGLSAGTSLSGFGDSSQISFNASLPMIYEVDLYRRYANEHHAAELDAEATRLDMESAAITLSAQVAESWYDVVNARIVRDALQEQLETNQDFYELVLLRFRQGQANAVDVHQQRQQLAITQAALSLVEGQRSVLSYQLAVLLGVTPGNVIDPAREAMPELPPPPAPGVPASLLEARPDLRAFQSRVEAADLRVASAIADRMPSITLSFAPSWTWLDSETTGAMANFSATTSGFTWSAGANLNVPLFDGQLRRYRVEQREAILDELVSGYADRVLTALLEVESAITLERQQHINVDNLDAQVGFAEATLEATQDRYRSGLSDFLPVLTALQSYQRTQIDAINAHRQLVSNRIQLHRAMGGSWPAELEDPTVDDDGAPEER